MEVVTLIEKYYAPGSKAYHFLIHHGRMVAAKALQVAGRLNGKCPASTFPDSTFIEEASLLHDIGIYLTHAPEIGCFGPHPYIVHGFLGREILEREGLPEHALVCERHVGMGLTVVDIEANGFPLPLRDMTPHTLEEKIICFADKFYSKYEKTLLQEKPVAEVRKTIARYGEDKLKRFDEWMRFFGEPEHNDK
ncbi:MAG: HD domain-containing protein [Alphaproteobacteria bacterium]|uniref:HD domain-containing protein n=1 Tax=Candidatus Nitrobium versatile TaxID=2884831 RepID=A0A953M1H3_9BACT|nr:HD domain-containing protein [Candidatus Nitrobium versatile]